MALQNVYNDVDVRRNSFRRGFILDPYEMAESGFYLHCSGFTQCFSCKVRLGDWIPEHIADVEHMKFSPRCPFMADKMTTRNSREKRHVDLIVSLLEEQDKLRGKMERLEKWLNKAAEEVPRNRSIWGYDEPDSSTDRRKRRVKRLN